MWTRFMDMYSGGGSKENGYEYIYIEAPREEAQVIFYNRFGHNPNRVSCTCCGEDYSISEEITLERASAYDRNCRWDNTLKVFDLPSAQQTVEEYEAKDSVLIIRVANIKPEERKGDIPE